MSKIRLKVGEPAPDGTALNQAGEPVELAALWSTGPTLLTFLRHFG